MTFTSKRINVYQTPPDGVARSTFRNVVAAAHMAYQLHNQNWKNRESDGKKTLPDVQEIAKHCYHTDKTVSRVVATEEFRMAMREKGIYWTARDGLTPEQIYAIGIMTNPADKRDMNGKLKAAGINYQIYRGWLKQPTFRNAVRRVGEDMLDDHIQDVHTALVNKAVGGDNKAIELYYQITGRFDPAKQQSQDLGALVNGLLEIIFRSVTDITVLKKITEDFERMMDGGELKPELIVDAEVIEPARGANDIGANGSSLPELAAAEMPPVGDNANDGPVGNEFDDSIPEGFFDFFDGPTNSDTSNKGVSF